MGICSAYLRGVVAEVGVQDDALYTADPEAVVVVPEFRGIPLQRHLFGGKGLGVHSFVRWKPIT